MQAPDPVETILARLMPPALSQDCQHEIEALIDDLAGPETENAAGISSGRWLVRSLTGGGIAAAVALGFAVFPLIHDRAEPLVQVKAPSGFVLVSESDRIQSMTDEGWQEEPDGSTVRALRFNAIEENSVRDEESGMVVQISEPREEILLMPISAF